MPAKGSILSPHHFLPSMGATGLMASAGKILQHPFSRVKSRYAEYHAHQYAQYYNIRIGLYLQYRYIKR